MRIDWKGIQVLSGVIEIFFNLTGVLVIWIYTFVKTPQFIHLRPVHFTTCKFFLNLKKFLKECNFKIFLKDDLLF